MEKKEQKEFERWGLFIGINKFDDPTFGNLKYGARDAMAISNTLLNERIGGTFESENVTVLTDFGKSRSELPTRNNIFSNASNMCENAEPEDEISLYFSGHGTDYQRKNYLICSDTQNNYIKDTAIELYWLKKKLEESKARLKVMIFDACHAGAEIRGVKNVMSKNFYKELTEVSEGMAVMSSCKQDELSWEMDKVEHGVFTHYMILGLEGSADTDKDEKITLNDLYSYTSKNVRRWAAKNKKKQNPTLEAKIVGDIIVIDKSIIIEEQMPMEQRISESYPFGISISTDIIRKREEAIEVFKNGLARVCGSLLRIYKKPSDIRVEEVNKLPRIIFPNGTIFITSPFRDVFHYTFQIDLATPNFVNQIINIIPIVSRAFNDKWKIVEFIIKKPSIDIDYIHSELEKFNASPSGFEPNKYIWGELDIKGLKDKSRYYLNFKNKNKPIFRISNDDCIFSEKITIKTLIDNFKSILL